MCLFIARVGKALLCAASDGDLAKALERQPMRRLTEKTIVNRTALRHDLALTRERGFAIDDEEHAFGPRCVAGLVFDEVGEPMAAISISGPAARISSERIAHLGAVVRRKADEITAQFGGALPEWRKLK